MKTPSTQTAAAPEPMSTAHAWVPEPGLPKTALAGLRVRDDQRTRLGGSALSILMHLLLAAIVLLYWPQRGGKTGAPSAKRSALVISLERGDANNKPVPPVPKPQPEVQNPPKPVPPPVLAKLPEPTPTLPHPAPPAKPKVAQPPKPQQQQAAAASQAASANAAKEKSQMEVDPNAENEALLQGVRARWLPPSKSRRDFHCRIKIDYQPGGYITAVTVQDSCGSAELDDSVERAIWKSQPLPLPSAQQAGNLLIEFTP